MDDRMHRRRIDDALAERLQRNLGRVHVDGALDHGADLCRPARRAGAVVVKFVQKLVRAVPGFLRCRPTKTILVVLSLVDIVAGRQSGA